MDEIFVFMSFAAYFASGGFFIVFFFSSLSLFHFLNSLQILCVLIILCSIRGRLFCSFSDLIFYGSVLSARLKISSNRRKKGTATERR